MEKNKGYVYVMINPSLEGLVKVGKTTKDPEERAKELSASTGVPTPFVVVYKKIFKNCHEAERTAHEILDKRGYRVNVSREFFSASISDAIDIILQIPDNDYSKREDDILENCDVCFKGNELAESYYELAEEHCNGRNGKFKDVDMALFYYEKSASLGCDKAYENIGDIWLNKKNQKKALHYYKKAVDNYHSNCYAKLAGIYMDPDSCLYDRYNALLAWTKYFEYLDQQKEFLLVKDEFSAYFVGFNLYDYFINYLSCGKIPNEHVNFIKTNNNAIIAVFQALIEWNNKYSKSSSLNHYISETILPYLYSIGEDKTFHICEEAQNLLFPSKGEKDVEKALKLYVRSAEDGAITALAYIGICFYEMGQIDKADKSLRSFYNSIYDLIVGRRLSVITNEQKQILLEAFFQIFYILTKGNNTNLIHKFYYMAAWQLGFIDYIITKLALLTNNMISTITNDTDGSLQGIETNDIKIISQIVGNVKQVIEQCQGQNWEIPHCLDI